MSNETYNAVLEYRKLGLINHPLSSPTDKNKSPGKRPLIKDWQNIDMPTEEQLKEWFLTTNNNVGLQCGARSNITVLDFDHMLFYDDVFRGVNITTRSSGRTTGRGHVYFKFQPMLLSQKHHDLGIEVLSTGSNAVMPPSIHATGDVYKWANPEAPIIDMPETVIKNLNKTFRTEAELKQIIAKCRHCFRDVIKRHPDMHGADGREYMIAVCTDIKAVRDEIGGQLATEEHIKMFAKLMYGKDYNEARTLQEWRNIDETKTWRCDKIAEKLTAYIDLTECEKCKDRREKYKEFKEGKKPKAVKEPVGLPPIPQEQIDQTPVTIQEVITGFKKDIHVDEDINISLPFDFAICNSAPCDSDVFGIVAPSGSGKTEEIRALGDTENQYVIPISSLTSHTFVSGLKDSKDLAPQLRGRMVTIKDFTTILSKNKDEVSGIFADLRDITDGYIQKTYGSEVGKKEYRGIHTSVLFACTNAIEKYYSVNSILGQRLIYFRPKTDPRQARIKAMKNAGKEKEIRDKHHALVMRLMNTVLTTQKARIDALTQNIPADMQERIGRLCEFLAIVRTHIDRDLKGDMASIPESELPTRLTKSLCKLVDGHSILYNRIPTYQDEAIALRLIHDNIPTERLHILKVLACFDEARTTSEIATAGNLPTPMVNRVLNDLASLGIIQRFDRETTGSRSDTWRFDNGDFKSAFLVATRYKILSTDSERMRGVIRYGVYDSEFLEHIKWVYQNEYKDDNTEYQKKVLDAFSIYLTDSHPADNQDIEPQQNIGNSKNCGICGNPLNGNSEQGAAGLGLIHPSCKFNTISIKALEDIPAFACTDGISRSFKAGEVKNIRILDANVLFKRKAAVRVED